LIWEKEVNTLQIRIDRIIVSMIAAVFILGLTVFPSYADTVSGELVDLACYLPKGALATGADHQKCALRCARAGQPIGLLTETGKVYLLIADHDNLTPFETAKTLMAQKVRITGPTGKRAGIQGLTVHKIKPGA